MVNGKQGAHTLYTGLTLEKIQFLNPDTSLKFLCCVCLDSFISYFLNYRAQNSLLTLHLQKATKFVLKLGRLKFANYFFINIRSDGI